ncbi:MAG: hypothetical protein AB8G15_00680 [Saprospiraceae bacterium]
MEKFVKNIMELISKDELPLAIKKLKELFDNSPLLDEVILQSGRYNSLMKAVRLGVVNFEHATISKNQIRYAMLDLCREVEINYDKNPVLKKSIDDQFNSTKTIKNMYHFGNGDIVGRDKIINK